MDPQMSRRSMLQGGALVAGALAGAGALQSSGAQAMAAPSRRPPWSVFTPGRPWYDTAGNLIEAHGGGMFYQDNTYYWVGANWQGPYGFRAFNLYSSANLQDWKFVNVLLEPSADLPTNHEVARPKILYNAHTSSYVMWYKRKDYKAPSNDVRAGVAVSESLEGPFSYLDDFFLGGDPQYNTADFGLWQESDGEAYIITSSPNELGGEYARRILIFRLAPDYRSALPEPVYIGPSANREAPAVFKRGDTYYLVTSGTSGWDANQSMYQTAPAIQGPWSEFKLLGDETSYGSQPDFIVTVPGSEQTTYLYAGGRHIREALDTSTYVWLPLKFNSGGMTMDFYPSWTLNAETGIWRPWSRRP